MAPDAENKELFDRAFLAARGAWPTLVMPVELFVRHVQERLPPDAHMPEALNALHVADLYLTCACVHGVDGAVACFEKRYAVVMTKSLKKIRGMDMEVDDARQIVLRNLLVGEGDATPKLANYSGRGSLESWVAIASRRVGLNLARGVRDHDDVDDSPLASVLPTGTNPEFDYLRTHYREEFRRAFEQATKKLTARERVILRMHILAGLRHDQIAISYQVDASTISRWIAKARATLLAEVERHFREKLNIQASEFHSIAAMVRSELDLSLARLLGDVSA